MAEQWTVVYVGDAIGFDGWEIHARMPDGRIHAHVFPKNIFEIRAAEYDLDPDDIDTLLDVVLHEPHIPDPTQPRFHATDAAAALGHVAADGSPVHLFNAPTVAAAREAHLARVEACKRGHVHITSAPTLTGGEDPLDVIRQAHRPDRERIAAIRAYVRETQQATTRRLARPQPASSRRPRPWNGEF